MGTFTNTKRYEDTVISLSDGLKNRLKNPYYAFTDKKPVIVEYYNRNIHESTLDEASKLQEELIGTKSPARYNLIHQASIFGNGIKLEQSLDIGPVGLESNPLELEFYVLPDTFIPYQEDFLTIPHSGKNHLFKVTAVTPDTLENGANFYKINIKYWTELDINDINKQIVEEYEMVVNYVGTAYKSVIKSSEYKLIEKLDEVLYRLFTYYNDLFFKQKVQCHVCPTYSGYYFYDPYLYEFIMRNDVFTNKGSYVHISQPIQLPETFGFKYDKSFFRALEEGNIKYFKEHSTYAVSITQPYTLFASRQEKYYYIDIDRPGFYDEQLTVIDPDLVVHIHENKLYAPDSNRTLYNIIVKYFNGSKITLYDIDTIEDLDYLDSNYLYYAIPEVMFIIEKNIKNILK